MKSISLFPEAVAHENGCGPVIDLGQSAGNSFEVNLCISRIMERQTLDAIIWGSSDGKKWGNSPILRLPHRYYCGSYQHTLDLSTHPDIRFVRLEYRMRGWVPQSSHCLATFSVSLEPQHKPEEALVASA